MKKQFMRRAFHILLEIVQKIFGASIALKIENEVVFNQSIIQNFLEPRVGKEYQISKKEKEDLIEKFKLIDQKISSATSWYSSVVLATKILLISPKIQGDIIECETWKGSSTAILSLIANMVKRKLIVADSFEGLPKDNESVMHDYPHVGVFGYYQEGMYSASLKEVKQNIQNYGNISVCRFLPGFLQKV